MVQGAWPVKTPEFRDQLMPTYHLAFCLSALEQEVSDPLVCGVVRRSLQAWQRQYLRDGLLRDLPGWHFTDWDPVNEDAARKTIARGPCRGQLLVLRGLRRLGLPSIDLQALHAAFWVETAGAYRLLEHGGPSPHATAAALASLPAAQGLDYLRDERQVRRRVSPYFAYFVALAMGKFSREEMIAFIKSYYGPLASRHGTICEKVADTASLAGTAGPWASPGCWRPPFARMQFLFSFSAPLPFLRGRTA